MANKQEHRKVDYGAQELDGASLQCNLLGDK